MIHPSSFVSPSAEIHPSACVGAWSIVDDGVKLGANVILDCRVHIFGGVCIGEGSRIFDGAVVGGDPQALKYKGEKTFLEIGKNCLVREYTTINRGCGENGLTKIDDDVLIMAYSHIGHDCILEQGAVIANGVQLGGHISVGKFATIGGGTFVQQFAKIGAYSFAGGTLKIDRDVPPCVRALGNPARFAGLNLHALQKHNFSQERISSLEKSFRELYRGKQPFAEVIKNFAELEECDILLKEFFKEYSGNLISGTASNSSACNAE
ncbi:acyl-[acyl-carrier-protein]--UDP-N-acetylglucosamine O-acyltransferase [Fibrobacterales bacterium]|nr:acyl-[acyl-carrier-protein]--UDP-N-acetylglucosamine O-acyltransferase [Fibrobacterales bacterium]